MLKYQNISVWWVDQPDYIRRFYKIKIKFKITTIMRTWLEFDHFSPLKLLSSMLSSYFGKLSNADRLLPRPATKSIVSLLEGSNMPKSTIKCYLGRRWDELKSPVGTQKYFLKLFSFYKNSCMISFRKTRFFKK